MAEITVPIQEGKVGVVLATDVYGPNGELLFSKGTRLSSNADIVKIRLSSALWVKVEQEKGGEGEALQAEAEGEPSQAGSHPFASGGQIKQARELLLETQARLKEIAISLEKEAPVASGEVEQLAAKIAQEGRGNQWLMAALIPEPLSRDLTFVHSTNVAAVCSAFARLLGIEGQKADHLCAAALLSDLGMNLVPQSVLLKQGPLTGEEASQVRKHPLVSKAMAEKIGGLDGEVLQAISQHHERLDGSGYPKGVMGTKLGDLAKLIGLADVYVAMISKRPHRKAIPPYRAVPRLFAIGNSLFGADLVEKLVRLVGVYPIGTVARLSTEELALVISVNPDHLLMPEVAVIFDEERVLQQAPERCINLAAQASVPSAMKIVAVADSKEFGLDFVEWLTRPVTGKGKARQDEGGK